ATMMSPSPLMYGANSMGSSALSNLLGAQESKMARQAKLSESEGVMLFKIVRDTADKLVDNYRNYKKTLVTLNKAATDLQDLQNMVSESRSGQDAARQVEMEYTIRKAQRDLDM